MNFQEQIDFGSLTLQGMTKIIISNIEFADKLAVKLHWKFEGKKIVATVTAANQIIFRRYYGKNYTHLNLAQMHLDWSIFMTELSRKRKRPSDMHLLKGSREAQLGGKMDIHPDYDFQN